MQEACSPARRRYWLAALFLGVTFGFAAYRHTDFAIWNDSAGLYHPHSRAEGTAPADLYARFQQDPLTTFQSGCLKESFLSTVNGGYRPLTTLWKSMATVFYYTTSYLPFPLLLWVGAELGLLAVSLFYVARRFVQHDLTALAVVLLVMGSPPLIGSAWVCVAGVQSLVPLLFCLSLLCYWSLVEGRRRVLCATGLVVLMLLGPWVREFFGLNALLLIFLEVRRARRPTWIMGTAALGFLHALFPTALIHWLFLPQLPLLPVYKIGLLSGQLDNGGIRWHAPWHFLPLFPPTLWVLAGLEALLRIVGGCSGAEKAREDWLSRIEIAVQRLVLPIWLVAIVTIFALEPRYHEYLGLTVCLGLAALGIRRDLFLGCWFLAMYLPILRVFSEHVHFLYAIPPAAIILAESMESLWLRLRAWPVLAWGRYVLAGVLVVLGVDQALNINGAARVNRTTYRGIDDVADWMVHHVPEGAAVVTNAIHGDEIKWHGDNRFEIYWTMTAGIDDARRAVDQPAQIEELLAHRNQHPVYFLDVDFDYPPDKAWYHSHKYVHHTEVPWRDLGVVHVSQVRYPFTDPLRYFVPRVYLPFLGAPDLENDFARRLSADRRFRHEVYAIYHVYEVTGDHLKPKLEGPVQLAQEGVDGFNILRVGLGFHALPQGEGAFDLDKFRRNGYSAQFSGLTLESVREQIRAFRLQCGDKKATPLLNNATE